MKPNWDKIDARLAHQIFSWNFDVILSLYIGLCRCVLDTYRLFNIILKSFSLYSCTSEPYSKICFDIIHIHCNKQLFFILSLSIDITEEGSDVGDDSDDGDFEPSLNFTLRFVMLISYVSVVTYILEILS